jgi:signal transduction histidine kinase
MTDARIRFSTEILRRLGEELNPSPDQSFLELVKNAYDADARHCRVELINTDEPGGTVLITDDGDGMELEAIQDGWLVIGRSGKSTREHTRLGRVPAGSKGLGRLAALRMGSAVKLATRPRGKSADQYHLRIDWSDFDEARVVDDVVLPIEKERRAPGTGQGTDITVENLRSHLGRLDVKRLARAMILLADPFGDDPEGFEPVLLAPEFGDLEKLVRERYFEDADYHLVADLHADGRTEARVVDWRGAELFRAKHEEVAKKRKGEPYQCPGASFHLWVFLLSRDNFEPGTATVEEVRTWLKAFGGVHIYYNGLRVAPYGNEGNDWLGMNLRRAQIPEERPGTHTSIGRVVIADREGILRQKTDRSGFIEDEAFEEMKAFAQDALDWMARRRLDVAEQRRALAREQVARRSSQSQKKIESAIATIPEDQRSAVQLAFEGYKKSRDREADQLRKEVQLYRTLSTAGITAATFAHESTGNPIKVISQSLNAIERRAKKELGGKYAGLLQKPIDNISRAVDSLAVLGRAVLRLLDHGKRRTGKVDLHQVVTTVLETFEPFLAGRDVTLEQDFCEGAPYLRGSDAAIESILANLLNNSLAAFAEGGGSGRRIRVRTGLEDKFWILRVSDNGPGFQEISLEDIWLPGQTTRSNGTGLGLAIVRDAAKDLGGTVEAFTAGDLGGAEVLIRLPILGV